MSYFAATVIKLDRSLIEKHPNADNLSLFKMVEPFRMTIVMNTDDWEGEEKAVFIQPDSVMPDTEEWAFLGSKRRVVPKRIRGIFSEGMLMRARPEWNIGDDVKDIVGITKYEPAIQMKMAGNAIRSPSMVPCYTDIENIKKYNEYGGILEIGERVILTEKIHGAAARYVYQDGTMYCGSRTQWYADDGKIPWSIGLNNTPNLTDALKRYPDIAIYGELYGQVQDLQYKEDLDGKPCKVRIFDIWDVKEQRYFDYQEFVRFVAENELDTVGLIYDGPYLGLEGMMRYAEGSSLIAANVREGYVLKPSKERRHDSLGRVIVKGVGEGYQTRKQK